MSDAQREKIDAFLLSFGVLNYALANRDPSYFEQLLLVFCVLPSVEKIRAIGKLIKAEGTCLLLLAYILWSHVWSAHAAMTLIGLLMSIICAGFLCGYIVTFQGNWQRILYHLLFVLSVLLVSSVLVGAMGHAMIGRTFAGVTFHRNQFGFLLGLLILFSLFLIRERLSWPPLITLVSGIAFLAYIDSKSAIISIVVTAALWLIVSSKWWWIWSTLALAGVLAFVLTLPSPKLEYFAARMGRDPTLTDRTIIWADSIKLLREQPVTGFGYNAVWSAFENRLSQYPNAPGPKYAHPFNVWLEWGLQLGIGGMLLYLVFLGAIVVRALALYRAGTDARICWQPVCVLVFVEIYNLANVSSVPLNRFGFFVLAVTSMCLFVRLHCEDDGVVDQQHLRTQACFKMVSDP
ncbi:O-antigen ligase family protein [Candidatus Entotheonella palauensis]|uniref:O-antigen ligase family protein n=1 Tax=Candidatus Entotheonella palauensis TaxID=93172 RepID=UPI000B7C5EA2|nr:O-antigen ligase family protein [Candidatus Entotheonella palauensis]